MSSPRRPTVRIPGLTNSSGSQDSIIMEIPSTRRSNTFSISYANQRPGNSRGSSSGTTPQRHSSEGEGDIPTSKEGQSENEGKSQVQKMITPTFTTTEVRAPLTVSTGAPQFQPSPHFSCPMSMSPPSQLSHLQHPHRHQRRSIHSNPVTPVQPASPIDSLSIELADAFQMVIQTMLQISPPQVLESAREQYSGCSLSVPMPWMSAMFTAMKTLNYMSANLLRFYSSESGSLDYSDGDAKVQNVFDIGELLQGVGDASSAIAAHAGVDLVLHYGEVDARHVHVKGDECGIAYALLHIVRQILDKAFPGDLIELGLVVTPHGVQSGKSSVRDGIAEGRVAASPTDMDSLRCSIKIEHKYSTNVSSESNQGRAEDCKSNGKGLGRNKQRPNPQLTTLLLRRLLRLIDAQFTIQNHVEDGQIYEVSLFLGKAVSPAPKLPGSISGCNALEEVSALNKDPSVEQLLVFGETLKGRKATLYGRSDSAFTRHITSYVTAWGMDINHVFSDGRNERSTSEETSTPVQESWFSTPGASAVPPSQVASISGSRSFRSENAPHLSFTLIDDDPGILRERLHALRAEQHPQNFNARARPSLVALHRSRSSPQLARVLGQSATLHPSPVVVFHFTSLANFKVTKDVIQSVIPAHGSTVRFPDVMIIPKPVGPRRFLTAMHTAVTRPTIDPFFFPTATSPGTLGVQSSGSLSPPSLDPNASNQIPQIGPSFNRTTQPHGSWSNSDRSTKEHLFASLPSPSPLVIPDNNNEYFPEPAGKLGLSPSSGYLVSSPDGQPAGIFFHPRSKKKASPQLGERIGNYTPTRRHSLIPRRLVGEEREIKSSPVLHEAQESGDVTAVPVTPAIPVKGNEISTPEPRSTPGSRAKEGGSSKATGKQPSQEKQDLIDKDVGVGLGKKSKSITPADGNIVPPISVLIVDDNPINQNILSTFMKRKKIRYDIANNGKEAVEKWKTGGFHLILMDIQMPIMDGIEATREIRRLEQLNDGSGFSPVVPHQLPMDILILPSASTSEMRSPSGSSPYRSSVIIVALTASSLQSDRVSALAAGCNDFLTKPVSLLWLNNKIIEWGSIKALQMWADIRPEAVRKMSKGQAAQARAVAERLHMPKNRKSPPRFLITEKSASPPELSTAVEHLTKFARQDVADGASASSVDPGDGTGPPVPFTALISRARPQKNNLTESSRSKTVEVDKDTHGTPHASSPSTNVSRNDSIRSIRDIVSDPGKVDVRQAPELTQAPLQDGTEPMSVASIQSAKSRHVD